MDTILIFGIAIIIFGLLLFFTGKRFLGVVFFVIGIIILLYGSGYFGDVIGGYLSNVIDNKSQSQISEYIPKVNVILYNLVDKYSNHDNEVSGNIRWFNTYDDVSLFVSRELLNVSIVNGYGRDTSSTLLLYRNYSEYFDGGDLYYDENLGSHSLDVDNNLKYKISKVGKIRDMVDESNSDYFVNKDCDGLVTRYNTNSCQVYSDSNTNTVKYNISTLSGEFSFPITIMTSGANSELRNFGLSFKFDDIDKPEGNEYTSIKFECVSGCNLLDTDKEYIDLWKSQGTIKLGNNTRDGVFEVYRVKIKTIDIVIGEDTDVWYLILDDLDGGMDIFGDEKAIPQIEKIDATYR